MRDIQNETDTRKIPLQKVGVKGVRYPVTVLDKNHKQQQTTATAEISTNMQNITEMAKDLTTEVDEAKQCVSESVSLLNELLEEVKELKV